MEWYTREEAEPEEDIGEVPSNRDIEDLIEKGFILVDKPYGPTSNQVTGWIKQELNLRKAGHFGTLDPNATGVLPVGLNKGTRIQRLLSDSDKEYVFEAILGEEKDEEEIRSTIKSFEGANTQLPPEKSAVKREKRDRKVYEAEMMEKKDNKVLGRVRCESGFYVRVMIEQLGDKLSIEAGMEELRRTSQGAFGLQDTSTVQEVVDSYHFYREGDESSLRKLIHPVEDALEKEKKIVVKNSSVNSVANGADLGATGISRLQDGIQEGERVAVMTLKGELVALAKAEMTSEKMYDSDKVAATVETVHLDPETYPKRWKQ